MMIEIDIHNYVGRIPAGHELVVMEKGDIESAMTLFGFDEVGMFDNMFAVPQYAFLEVC
jgi:hypothetical protein